MYVWKQNKDILYYVKATDQLSFNLLRQSDAYMPQ